MNHADFKSEVSLCPSRFISLQIIQLATKTMSKHVLLHIQDTAARDVDSSGIDVLYDVNVHFKGFRMI